MTEIQRSGRKIVDARVRLPVELRPPTDEPEGLFDQYDAVLNTGATRDKTLEDLIADMDGAGVGRALVHAEWEYPTDTDALNEAVAQLVADNERFVGVGTIAMPPRYPTRAVQQVKQASASGLVGISIQPAFADLDMDDRWLYPVYAECEELELTMCVHTGVNYSPEHRMDHEAPHRLDRIAGDFPGLRIVACHAGWPYVTQMVAIARRHTNVYLEFGGLAPKYVDAPDSGWAPLRRMMRNLLRGQILFGTDWPVMSQDPVLGQWEAMDLSEDVLEQLCSVNVAKAFRLDHG